MTDDTPSVKLRLSFFEDFETVAGLVRDTGARRTDSRDFVLDRPMQPAQLIALLRLLEYSRQDANQPVHVVEMTPQPPLSSYRERSEELYAWWGTVDQKPWLTDSPPEGRSSA
jgi:hypothetical protein